MNAKDALSAMSFANRMTGKKDQYYLFSEVFCLVCLSMHSDVHALEHPLLCPCCPSPGGQNKELAMVSSLAAKNPTLAQGVMGNVLKSQGLGKSSSSSSTSSSAAPSASALASKMKGEIAMNGMKNAVMNGGEIDKKSMAMSTANTVKSNMMSDEGKDVGMTVAASMVAAKVGGMIAGKMLPSGANKAVCVCACVCVCWYSITFFFYPHITLPQVTEWRQISSPQQPKQS
jgi:hypothetical protein